ncbi:MAG: sulfatase-like hydrolase/transferase [Planctomycetota bacterium]|jgi:arylsulfatase A-like enzyme
MARKRPNIVIFSPDHYRGEALAHMGNACVQTPNLDRLCRTDAVSFRNAFCQNPVCTPSRCSFMSGWYPHVRGHRTMFHMLRHDEPVLLRRLKEEGYFVWWGGKNDLVPAQHGFDEYCDVKYVPPRPLDHDGRGNWRGEPDGDTFYSFFKGQLEKPEAESLYYDHDWAMVLGAIEQVKSHDGERPLCIYLPLVYPHPPFAVEEPFFSMIDRSKVPPRIPAPENWTGKPSMLRGIYERSNMQGWTEERWNELRAVYYGMCSRVDHQLGLLIDALREKGTYDATAIFFFSDHGAYVGDYGLVDVNQNTFEDSLIRVPLVIKPPADVPAKAGISDAMVELLDFPATVEDMLGLKPRQAHFGRSLLPLIAGQTQGHRDAVFCEGGRLHGERHCMELEYAPGRDPRDIYYPRLSLQAGEGPEHTKAVMCRTSRYKYVRRLYEDDELYDLLKDPAELNNRAGDPRFSAVLAELKQRLLRFFVETGDVVPFEPDSR